MILQPNVDTPIAVGGRGKYLIVRQTSAPVFVAADGLSPQRLESGDRVNVLEFEKMFLSHRQSYAVDFDYQISDLEHKPASTSGLVVQRIIEPIHFEATVKVQDGLKVATIAPQQMTTKPDITIEPQNKVKISAGGAHQITVQVISDEMTSVRLGDFNVTSNRGLLVYGSQITPGSMTLNCSGELYAYNASQSKARISVMEVK